MRAVIITLLALAATPAAAQERLTVLLDWFVNPDHAALVVAQERGLFAEHGLDVDLVAPADPNDPPKLVAAGQADIAVGYQPQLHLQRDAGLPLVRIGTLVATPLNALVVLDDGPIEAIEDLKGKRVGYSVGGFEEALLGGMLAHSGLALDDVELVNVNFSLSPALMAGRVDAVIGAFRNFELNQMAINGSPGRAFYPEEAGVPAYDELILLAKEDALDDPRLKAFLEAIEEATLYTLNHPEDAFDLFKASAPELDDELNERAWSDTLPRLALRPAALDHRRYARFADFLHGRGLIGPPPPVGAYAVDPFAEQG